LVVHVAKPVSVLAFALLRHARKQSAVIHAASLQVRRATPTKPQAKHAPSGQTAAVAITIAHARQNLQVKATAVHHVNRVNHVTTTVQRATPSTPHW
jgi:methyl coenzyme M reductase subunit C